MSLGARLKYGVAGVAMGVADGLSTVVDGLGLAVAPIGHRVPWDRGDTPGRFSPGATASIAGA